MVSKGQNFFFLKKVLLHITLSIKMFDLMHAPDLLGWVKRSDMEIVHISIICLNLIGFGYDLSDTQDGHVLENGIYIL